MPDTIKSTADALGTDPPSISKSQLEFLTTVHHRETPEFRLYFARWLAEQCGHPSIRAAFDTEPQRLVAAHRRRTPATALQIYDRHHSQLVSILAGLPVWSQVVSLNRRLRDLRDQGLIAAEVPDAFHEEVEDLFFGPQSDELSREFMQGCRNRRRLRGFLRAHPHFQPYQFQAARLTFQEELGDAAAARFARQAIPDEFLWLSSLAHELHAVPDPDGRLNQMVLRHLNGEAQPDDAMPSGTPLIQLLSDLLARLGGSVLEGAARRLLRLHLDSLLPAPDGEFQQRRRIVIDCRELPRWPDLRLLRRAVLRNRDACDSIRQFYFPGLGWDELRCNRSLVGKLLHNSFEDDTSLLIDFLFSDTPRRPRGLVPRWRRRAERKTIQRTTERFAHLDLIICHTWPELCADFRSGKKETELAGLMARRLGIPKSTYSTGKFMAAFARRRERLGLIYPLRQ